MQPTAHAHSARKVAAAEGEAVCARGRRIGRAKKITGIGDGGKKKRGTIKRRRKR